MIALLQVLLLVLAAAAGTAVVLTRSPREQAIPLSFFGLVLATLFFLLQAPDVALSEIAVGGILVPAMTLLTLAKLRELEEERRREPEPAGERTREASR